MLEIHYTNYPNFLPSNKQGYTVYYTTIREQQNRTLFYPFLAMTDNSGFRLLTSPGLRATESDNVIIGAAPPNQIVPPKMAAFTTFAYCSKECSSQLPQGGVTAFAVVPRTHSAGIDTREFTHATTVSVQKI